MADCGEVCQADALARLSTRPDDRRMEAVTTPIGPVYPAAGPAPALSLPV
jgi:hypothetical protein